MTKFEIKLNKKDIKNPRLLTGFHGQWMLGPILIQYLTEQENFEQIGYVYSESIPPVILINNRKIIKPLTLLWNEENNLVILQSLIPISGKEWEISEIIEKIVEKLGCKEVFAIDGVSTTEEGAEVYFATNQNNYERLKKAGAKELDGAIIRGMSSALLIKDEIPLTCIYGNLNISGEDENQMAMLAVNNNQAIVNVINFLIDYMKLDIDIDELEEKTTAIQNNINKVIEQINVPEKRPEYFG